MVDGPIVVEEYDPAWALLFEQERSRLEPALEPWLVAPVEHIGSTSVPGLPAKPILDMLAGVGNLAEARAAIAPLAALGYVHAEHRPRALYFYRRATGDPGDDTGVDTHHLHLTEPGSDLWRERLAFRDALRADPELAGAYRDLKRRLADEHPGDLSAYTAGKRDFVAMVLARSGIVLRPHA